jgi:hypothetical protein
MASRVHIHIVREFSQLFRCLDDTRVDVRREAREGNSVDASGSMHSRTVLCGVGEGGRFDKSLVLYSHDQISDMAIEVENADLFHVRQQVVP